MTGNLSPRSYAEALHAQAKTLGLGTVRNVGALIRDRNDFVYFVHGDNGEMLQVRVTRFKGAIE